MKALINPSQENFVVQVESNDQTFEIGLPLYWETCPDTIVAYQYQYIDGQYVEYIPPIQPKTFAPLNPAQVRLVLHQFGLLDTVETAIVAGDKSLQIEWDYRTEFARNNELLVTLAVSLGITDSQLDSMFELGVTL